MSAHLSLAFTTLELDEYTKQVSPSEAIFLPRLKVVPEKCCPVANVPDLNTPEFVIGCSLQNWGLASTGLEMQELLLKPHLSAYREHYPSAILALLGFMYAVSAIGSLATYFMLDRVLKIRSFSNAIRWTAHSLTSTMIIMILAVLGSMPMHNDMMALMLFGFATTVFMYFTESGLDLTANSEYSAVHASVPKELENGALVSPENAKLSPLDGYLSPMLIGWVCRIGLWSALLHGYVLRISTTNTDTDYDYPAHLMVAFISVVVGSATVLAIQLSHVCVAKQRKEAKQIMQAIDFTYTLRALIFEAIFGWAIYAGLA
jgi:hypothetical protein